MLKKIANIGIQPEFNIRQRRVVQLLNFVSCLLSLIFIPLAIMNFMHEAYTASILLLSATILYVSNIFWNSRGLFLVSKFIMCFYIILTPYINALLGGMVPSGQFISQIVASLVFTMLAMLLFESKKERLFQNITLSFYFIHFLFFDKIMIWLISPSPNIDFLVENYIYYKFPTVMGMILIIITITIFKNIINNYETENEQFKEELAAQNEELLTMNDHLEERVKQRTLELEQSNNRILNIGFLTSHKIRGPLASILGITQLFQLHQHTNEISEVLPKLHDRALEMDEVIKDMTKELEDNATS